MIRTQYKADVINWLRTQHRLRPEKFFTTADIVVSLYKGNANAYKSVEHHLSVLFDEGKIEKREETFRAWM